MNEISRIKKLTWDDYAKKVYATIIHRHPQACYIIMVNDYYGNDVINIKDDVHASRGQKFIGGESPKLFPTSSKPFPSVKDAKSFFKNKGNKQRLQIFLKQEICKMATMDERTVIYYTREECTDISVQPEKPLPSLSCDHIEADTAMFFLYSEIREAGHKEPVVI